MAGRRPSLKPRRWVDALAAGGSALAALLVHEARVSPATTLLVLAVALAWCALLSLAEQRHAVLLARPMLTWLRAVATAGVQLALLLGCAAWLVSPSAPKGLVLICFASTVILTVTSRLLLLAWDSRASTSQRVTRVLLAGSPDGAKLTTSELLRSARGRLAVVGWCAPDVAEVAEAARLLDADDVILLPCAGLNPEELRRLAWRLDDQGRGLHLSTGLVGVRTPRTEIDTDCGIALVNVRHSELMSVRRTLLQGLGRVFALVLLVLLAPLLLATAVAVRLDSPGAALFRQRRVGADGRRFTMIKFRTMTDGTTPDAARSKDDAGNSVLFKMRTDPRVTRLGGFLRRYSLDELPQLINVVRGDMALVGPRPALTGEVASYEPDAHRRFAARPGMTGLWQVSGRSDLSWSETVRLDLEYVDNWTPGLDLQILFRTVAAVLSHNGAY